MKPEMAQLRQTAVQNQTATMLEIGSTLLNQSAEQSRKLTDVEAQVGGGRGAQQTRPHVPTAPGDGGGRRDFSAANRGAIPRDDAWFNAEVAGLCAGQPRAR